MISSKCTASVRFMLTAEAILTLQILTTNSSSHFQKTVIPQEMKTTTYPQNLSTGISLVILSGEFSLLGILSFSLMLRHDGKMAEVRNPSPSPRIAEVRACGRVHHRIRQVYHWLR